MKIRGLDSAGNQEQEVDLSEILATREEFNLGYQRRVVGVTITEYYNRPSLVTFPSSLSLNRSTEEPPYPRCMHRAVTWRRIMSCIAPETRPDYFLTNREEALEEGYSNVTWKIGNLCVQVVAVTNAKLLSVHPTGPEFISAAYQPLNADDLLQLRVIGHKNLCILGLLLFVKYLDHAWNLTYHQFMGPEHSLQSSNQFRCHCVLAVHTQVCGLLISLLKTVKGKKDMNMSNQFLETDPIFDSDVLRMYIWDLIMIYDEYCRGSEVTQSDGATNIEEFTNNIYRDRPGLRDYFSQPRMRVAVSDKFFAGTIPWSGNYEVDRWEFVRHLARMENREPVFSNPDLLINMRATYGTPGAITLEPSFQARRTYSSHVEMQALRRADGIWDLDEPFHNDEVDTFRIFMLWKVGNWQSLTQVRPPAAYLTLFGPNTRITIYQT
jgi:hypothetical protein